jgi:hypothetical protein
MMCVEHATLYRIAFGETLRLLISALLLSFALPISSQTFHVDEQYLSVKGKWKSTTGREGDEIAFKQVIEIDCFKSQKTCVAAKAELVRGSPDIFVGYYEIVRWDIHGLVAQNGTPICVTNQLIVNFNEKSVTAIDTRKAGVTNDTGPTATYRTQTFKLVSQY